MAEGKRENNLLESKTYCFKPPPSEEAHKHSKRSQSQENPGDSCKAMWLGSDSCLPSQPCCLVSSTLDSSQICHHRFSTCSKFTWRQVFALHDQHGYGGHNHFSHSNSTDKTLSEPYSILPIFKARILPQDFFFFNVGLLLPTLALGLTLSVTCWESDKWRYRKAKSTLNPPLSQLRNVAPAWVRII